jgi:hypothetical protein
MISGLHLQSGQLDTGHTFDSQAKVVNGGRTVRHSNPRSLPCCINSQRPLDAKFHAVFILVARISKATPMHPIYGLVLCEGGVLQYRGRSSKTPIFSGGLILLTNLAPNGY